MDTHLKGPPESGEKFSDILETLAESPDGAYAVDMDQRVIFWNAAAERILGYAAAETVGRHCHQVVGGVSDQGLKCEPNCVAILLARRGRIAPSKVVQTRKKDGQPVWLSITHVLLPAANHDLSTLLHIFHDVTASQATAGLLTHISEQLAAAERPGPKRTPAPPDGARSAEKLTQREQEVLALMARGLGTGAIASELGVAHNTVRNHIQRILEKLDAETRLQAVAAASRLSIL